MQVNASCDPSCRKFDTIRSCRQERNYAIAKQKLEEAYTLDACHPCAQHKKHGPQMDTLFERKNEWRPKNQDKVVINLPAYIVNSHALNTSDDNDVSRQYNLQLKSPDNENLYVNEHQVLLQVMSQYVYYRKLCIWIKDELKKRRLELLDAARRALIDARDGEDCGCHVKTSVDKPMPDRALTDVEKEFLRKLAEGQLDVASLNPPKLNSMHTGTSTDKPVKKKRKSTCVIL